MSGLKHYQAEGYIFKEYLCTPKGQRIGLFNFEKSGFFLTLKGYNPPSSYALSYRSYLTSEDNRACPIEVQIPAISADKAREYQDLDLDLEDSPRSLQQPPITTEDLGEIVPIKEKAVPYKVTSKLLETAYLWHERLGHISLSLLKKTARVTSGIPNFNAIKELDFYCLACT